jgi:hypothetical protein
MISKNITIEPEKQEKLLQTIREYAKNRNYVLREEIEENKHIFAIYDRERDRATFTSTLQVFLGNSLIPERIRLKGSILKTNSSLEVNVRGDVMMNEFNYINDRPKRRDALRCETIFDNFINKINHI